MDMALFAYMPVKVPPTTTRQIFIIAPFSLEATL
jgi:hypothetical protein